MANSNAPMGLMPLELDFSRCHMYPIELDYNTNIFVNDPVVLTSGGFINVATCGQSDAILGSLVGVFKSDIPSDAYGRSLLPVGYYPGSAAATEAYWAMVADDVNQTFLIQEAVPSSGSTQLTVAAQGAYVYLYTGTGDATYGTNLSAYTFDPYTLNTTAAYGQLKLMYLQKQLDLGSGAMNAYGAYAKWVVRIASAVHQNNLPV